MKRFLLLALSLTTLLLGQKEFGKISLPLGRVQLQKGGQVVLTADANLWREDLRIYEVSDIVVGISAAEQKKIN